MFARGIRPRPAPQHLPELDLREDWLCKDQIADLRHVDAGIEHIHRDRHAGEGLVLEVVDEGVGAGVVRDDDPCQTSFIFGIQGVERLVQPPGMLLGYREEDRLCRKRPGLIHLAPLHELPHDRLRRSFDSDLLLQLRPLEVDLVRVDALLDQSVALALRQVGGAETFDLEVRLRSEDAFAEVDQDAVLHRLVVGVERGRHMVVAVEEPESVPVDQLGGCRRQPDLHGVQVRKDVPPLVVDAPVRLVGEDQVELAWRDEIPAVLVLLRVDLLKRLDRGDVEPPFLVVPALQDLVLRLVGEELQEALIPRLVAERLPVGEEEHLLCPVFLQEGVDDRHRNAGLPRAGRHDDQPFAVAFVNMLKHTLDVLDALRAVDDAGVDLDRFCGIDLLDLEAEPLKVFLCVEALHQPERVALPVPEPYLVAVREEDEDVPPGLPCNIVGVLLSLLLPDERVF
ncbi:hypothetical protein DSECCO2_514320 [anaerobic digester metagenome]